MFINHSIHTPSNKEQYNIFIIVEQSQALSPEAQRSINWSMEVLLERLRVWSRDNQIQVNIDCLVYSKNAKWITHQGPEPIDEFLWDGIYIVPNTSASSSFGSALCLLSERLNYIRLSGEHSTPPSFFFFLANTNATDEYQHNVEPLKNNPLFSSGRKLAINICNGVTSSMLLDIIEHKELIITDNHLGEYLKILFASHYKVDKNIDEIGLCIRNDEFAIKAHNKKSNSLVEIEFSHTSIKLGETNSHQFTRCQLGPCDPRVASSTAISLSVKGDEWNVESILTNHMDISIPIIRKIEPQRSTYIHCKDAQGNFVNGIEFMHDIKNDNSRKQRVNIQVNNNCLFVENTSLADPILIKVMVPPDGSILLSHKDKLYTANFKSCIMTYKDLSDWD